MPGYVVPKELRESMLNRIAEELKKNPFIPKAHLYYQLRKTDPNFTHISERTFSNWAEEARQRTLSKAEFSKPITQAIEEDRPEVDVEDGKKYSIDQGEYAWNTKRGPIRLSIERADKLFYEYSEHGLNKTGAQIMNKYGFKPWEWSAIKNVLSLFKKSNIFSPFTEENTPPDKLEEMKEAKINFALSDKRNIENVYQRTVVKKYKKEILEDQTKDLAFQILIDSISDKLTACKVIPTLHRFKKGVNGVIVASTADWHLGARVEGLKKTPVYNPEILKSYLEKSAQIINSQNAKEVHLNILGDVIESFTGKNHMNSFMSIDFGYYGAEVVEKAYELIVWYASKINNLVSISGIGGNHDRWSESNKLDTKGEVLRIIFHMLKITYGDKLKIVYGDSIISQEVDGIHYILVHGHNGKDRKKMEKTVFEYGNQEKYNLILGAHLHSRNTFDDSRRGRRMCIPSMFTGNEYSEELGFNTLPGFIITKNNGNGYPVVMDFPL